MHADGGRGEGVLGRENEGAPVLAIGVGCLWCSIYQIMPFEDVGFTRVRGYVGRRIGLEGGVLAREAFVGGFGCHGGGCNG